MKIGFIGVGNMGGPICRNLIKNDYSVLVHDIVPEAAARCTELGAAAAKSPRAVAEACDVVFTSLAFPHIVEEVVLGPDGIAEGLHDGLIVVDLSTNDPVVVKRLAAELGRRGVPFLDAPVSGGTDGAEAATISVIVGGDRAAYDNVLPMLQAIGKSIYHVGPSGAGSVFKIVNNMLAFCNMAAANEALMLISKTGHDPETFLDVVEQSSGASAGLGRLRRKVLAGNFEAEFTMDLAYKDLGLALKLGEQAEVPLVFPGAVNHILLEGRALGMGSQDVCAMMRVLEHNLRLEVRAPASR